MKSYENAIYQTNPDALICGTDEVGRGALAGPVVAAAVILKPDFFDNLIQDSKTLSEKQRNKAKDMIEANAIAYAFSIVSVKVIDQINIKNAARLAMTQAIKKLIVQPTHALVDFEVLNLQSINQTSIVKGDAKSISIAAASILAKVYRDALMKQLAKQHPVYQLDKNKGYGTLAHRQAIKAHGTSKLHRQSFKLKSLK